MGEDRKKNNIVFKDQLPLLPVRDLVVYPFMILPLFVGRESSIAAIEYALEKSDRTILLAAQKDITAEHPATADIFNFGTVAMIMRVRRLPDGRIKVLVQGLSKAKISGFTQDRPFFKANIEKVDDLNVSGKDVAVKAVIKNIKEQLGKTAHLGKGPSPDLLVILEDIHDPGRFADLVAGNLDLNISESQNLLETLNPQERLHKIHNILQRELDVLVMQKKIKRSINDDASKEQREYFLREQIRAIKSELGEGDEDFIEDEFDEFKKKIAGSGMHKEAEKEVKRQLHRLERMHPDSSESSIVKNYIEWMTELPWNKSSKDHIDIDRALEVLDKDHFDLKKIKERILEYLAVRQLKGNTVKGPILCFTGPPGVGKTSLGKSIARAIGRKFIRMSLGGIKDEAEIRGHRRTYVGSMPGRFIQAPETGSDQ